MVHRCPQCHGELKKRAPNILPNIKRRKVGDSKDRFVCMSCRESFSSFEIEWDGDQEIWHKSEDEDIPESVPDECPMCGNEDIDVTVDKGVYEWNWTCTECMSGDFSFKQQF